MEIRRLGVYLHIPFCVRKCRYCDFLSNPAEKKQQAAYLHALKEQITLWGQRLKESASCSTCVYLVDTVFIGGGTPSLLETDEIRAVLMAVKESFFLTPDAEISIECNPGTASKEKLECWKETGINRISFGLQSANLQELRTLGRIHDWDSFLDAYQTARRVGFSNINVDLMTALPGQSVLTLAETLKKVLALEPEHISAYSLIIEEGTPFYDQYRDGEGLPTEEEEAAMDELLHRVLQKAGYERYEISNYAKPGCACRHNIKYWEKKEYLGLGLGAVSYMKEDCGLLGDHAESGFFRFRNPVDLNVYETMDWSALMTEKDASEWEPLSLADEQEEFLFMGLRMSQGISVSEFEDRFHCGFGRRYGEKADHYIALGLMRWEYDRVCFTERGMDVSNTILADLV